MREVHIVAEPHPPRAWTETVVRGVDNHNIGVTGLADYYPVGFFVKGDSGEIFGGLLGDIWGGWMLVGSLWVSAAIRGRGYARELMARAHQYALDKHCTHAYLRTASYEARPLYERLGYTVYAELEDHPIAPHSRYFMMKRLAVDESHPLKVKDFGIAMDPYPSNEAAGVIRNGISWHAHAAIGIPETEWSPINFFLRDEAGEIFGGVLGNLWGDWMYVAYVWVDRALRGNGYASKMLAAAEEHAVARGCSNAFLDTFSFQARPLYEKNGYELFGVEEEHPKGHQHYLLKKKIQQAGKTPRHQG